LRINRDAFLLAYYNTSLETYYIIYDGTYRVVIVCYTANQTRGRNKSAETVYITRPEKLAISRFVAQTGGGGGGDGVA